MKGSLRIHVYYIFPDPIPTASPYHRVNCHLIKCFSFSFDRITIYSEKMTFHLSLSILLGSVSGCTFL